MVLAACAQDGGGSTSPAPSAYPPPVTGTPATVTLASPSQNATVPVGPVTVSFTTQFFTIGTPGQPHLHFYLDTDPVPYMFYNGVGINADNGVLYSGVHTHFAHWKSAMAFDIFGLSSTAHTVRFVLADQTHNELPNQEATKTLTFSVSQPAAGNEIQEIVAGSPAPQAGERLVLKNLVTTPLPSGISWMMRNGSCFQIEYYGADRRYVVVTAPWPPEVEPDMDAIREAVNRPRREEGRDPLT